MADIINSAGRWAGASTAAMFIHEFVKKDVPWAHLDIAGPAFSDSAKPYMDAGATGVMVRTLVTLAESL